MNTLFDKLTKENKPPVIPGLLHYSLLPIKFTKFYFKIIITKDFVVSETDGRDFFTGSF